MSNRQPLVNEHPLLSNEINIIEEDSVKEEESPIDEPCLEDALDAWQEINSLVRTIGRSLIKREVKALKRSAQEVAERCRDLFPHDEQQRDDSTPITSAGKSDKRRRVSGFEEDFAEQKSVALLRRMARMKRMNAVLVSLNNSHGLLEQEIRGIIDEESREKAS